MADDDPLPALCGQFSSLLNNLHGIFSEISSVLTLQNIAINKGDSRLTEHYNELLENHIHSAQNVNKVIVALEKQFKVSASELMPEMWEKNTVLWGGILEQNGKNRQACREQIVLLK
jgi:hypothetical protein